MNTPPFYAYFLIMFFVALFLVLRSKVTYKFELFFVVFYLLTGEINEMLTFKIPGISFFEIQPARLLLLIFLFFFVRRLFYPAKKREDQIPRQMPLFLLVLILFVLSVTISLLVHVHHIGIKDALAEMLELFNLLLIIYGLRVITEDASIDTLGKTIILAGIISALISVIQVGIEPMFLRMGEQRPAFGSVLRSNGIFHTERENGFFLLAAMVWVLTMFYGSKKSKYLLTGILAAGILTTFHRMSWLLMALILILYFTTLERISLDRLVLIGLTGLALLVGVLIFSFEDIKESSLVQERLADTAGGRPGYYKLALESIGDKPIFGYGNKDNDVYYYGMMKVTGSIRRATGETGGFHSGYFSTMFYYGLPSFFLFTAFVILVIVYFARLSAYQFFFVIPFFLGLLYAIGNLTNTNLFSTGGIIFVIHVGLGLGARRLKSYFPTEALGPISGKKALDEKKISEVQDQNSL